MSGTATQQAKAAPKQVALPTHPHGPPFNYTLRGNSSARPTISTFLMPKWLGQNLGSSLKSRATAHFSFLATAADTGPDHNSICAHDVVRAAQAAFCSTAAGAAGAAGVQLQPKDVRVTVTQRGIPANTPSPTATQYTLTVTYPAALSDAILSYLRNSDATLWLTLPGRTSTPAQLQTSQDSNSAYYLASIQLDSSSAGQGIPVQHLALALQSVSQQLSSSTTPDALKVCWVGEVTGNVRGGSEVSSVCYTPPTPTPPNHNTPLPSATAKLQLQHHLQPGFVALMQGGLSLLHRPTRPHSLAMDFSEGCAGMVVTARVVRIPNRAPPGSMHHMLHHMAHDVLSRLPSHPPPFAPTCPPGVPPSSLDPSQWPAMQPNPTSFPPFMPFAGMSYAPTPTSMCSGLLPPITNATPQRHPNPKAPHPHSAATTTTATARPSAPRAVTTPAARSTPTSTPPESAATPATDTLSLLTATAVSSPAVTAAALGSRVADALDESMKNPTDLAGTKHPRRDPRTPPRTRQHAAGARLPDGRGEDPGTNLSLEAMQQGWDSAECPYGDDMPSELAPGVSPANKYATLPRETPCP
jgi:hypothetical protein